MPAQLLNAPLHKLALAVLGASLVISLLMTPALKIVAERVFKFRVRMIDAFKAMFVSTFALTGILFGLIRLRLLNLEAGGGILLQVLALVVGLMILAFTITAFIKSPEGESPDFAQAGVVAAIMQVIALLIALAITYLGAPLNGAP